MSSTTMMWFRFTAVWLSLQPLIRAFSVSTSSICIIEARYCRRTASSYLYAAASNEEGSGGNADADDSQADNQEWTSDFDDVVIGDDAGPKDGLVFRSELYKDAASDDASSQTEAEADVSTVASIFKKRSMKDLTATQSRLFSLGTDLVLSDFVGNMGFQEVTDWEYFYQDEEDPDNRKVVQPNPLDATQPRRTRSSSGSVVRVFRGEFVGRIGGSMSAQGLDRRVLVKEFTGDMALQLARYELLSVGKLQSDTMYNDDAVASGDWLRAAASRSAMARTDDRNVIKIVQNLKKSPYLGILGEVNLAELDGMDANEFYRALGVPPPKPEAIWIVYEYAGLNTISSYCTPPQLRRAKLPPKKGFFGSIVEPPPLPAWRARANFIVKGIMKGSIEALAKLHESGIAHRSIGRSSLIISSTTMDKREATDLYNTRTEILVVKLADFGFSGILEESSFDEDFCRRARSFGLSFRRGENSLTATNFAMAEDLHALGFVFLGLIMSTLVELPRLDFPMPATDEDTLQRLLGEIFDKDVQQFREYLMDEEIWDSLVNLLDEKDGAGWKVLETLFLAREKVAESKGSMQMITARGLLSNPFFD